MPVARLALRSAFWLTIVIATTLRTDAVTRVNSADGQFWDIQDTSPWAQDSGGIATGGRANPFNGFGYLKLQVRSPGTTLLVRNQYMPASVSRTTAPRAPRFDHDPVLRDGIVVAARFSRRRTANYLRYFDSFTKRPAISVASSESRGAAPPGRTKKAGASRWRPRRTAIDASTRPTRSSR